MNTTAYGKLSAIGIAEVAVVISKILRSDAFEPIRDEILHVAIENTLDVGAKVHVRTEQVLLNVAERVGEVVRFEWMASLERNKAYFIFFGVTFYAHCSE